MLQHAMCCHVYGRDSTTFFRREDTNIPFTSPPHPPSSPAWACPACCFNPVARLKQRIATAVQPTGWPEPPLAGEENSADRRTHEVVTPPVNLYSEDEDAQPETVLLRWPPHGIAPQPRPHATTLVRAPHLHTPHPTLPSLQLYATPAFSQTTPPPPQLCKTNCVSPNHSISSEIKYFFYSKNHTQLCALAATELN